MIVSDALQVQLEVDRKIFACVLLDMKQAAHLNLICLCVTDVPTVTHAILARISVSVG